MNTVRDYIKKLRRNSEAPGIPEPGPGLPHPSISVRDCKSTRSFHLFHPACSRNGYPRADTVMEISCYDDLKDLFAIMEITNSITSNMKASIKNKHHLIISLYNKCRTFKTFRTPQLSSTLSSTPSPTTGTGTGAWGP